MLAPPCITIEPSIFDNMEGYTTAKRRLRGPVRPRSGYRSSTVVRLREDGQLIDRTRWQRSAAGSPRRALNSSLGDSSTPDDRGDREELNQDASAVVGLPPAVHFRSKNPVPQPGPHGVDGLIPSAVIGPLGTPGNRRQPNRPLPPMLLTPATSGGLTVGGRPFAGRDTCPTR